MNKGEIWFVDCSGRKGHEQSGKRPAVIAGHTSNLATIIPLTTSPNSMNFPFTHAIKPTNANGLRETSIALIFQITTVDNSLCANKIGKLSDDDSKIIDALLKDFLKLK